jgi:hypothetical protein
MTYNVEITGAAASEVEKVAAETGDTPGQIVSQALAALKWIRESEVYEKQGSKFVEVEVALTTK